MDGTDYSLIDNGFASHLTGWVNGDFNYDGAVDSTDYTLIDYAYNNQGGSLAAIAQMSHWKMPGYAEEYLPIYEANFGKLSATDEQQYLDDGTPGDLARPAFAMSVAAVPEPSGLGLMAVGAGLVLRRRKRGV